MQTIKTPVTGRICTSLDRIPASAFRTDTPDSHLGIVYIRILFPDTSRIDIIRPGKIQTIPVRN